MKNEIVKIETTQLETVVNESGLAIHEGEEIKKSYLPFLGQLAEVQSQATKINFDSPAEIDEIIARELRLKTVKIRTGSKELKDERKKGYLLRGNLEQAAYNLIEASCKLTEDIFVNVEKAREFAEKKRKEQLRIERSEKLASYVAVETIVMYPLSEMSDEQFTQLYDGLKLAAELKIEADKKAEEKRLAEIEAERVRQEEIRIENEKLKAEAEKREKELAAERKKIEAEREAERKIAADKQKAIEDAAKVEREKAESLAKAEAEKRERLEAALKAKEDAERKAKEDEEARLQAELSKGDSAKVDDLISDLDQLKKKYVFKSQKNKKMYADVSILIEKVIQYIQK